MYIPEQQNLGDVDGLFSTLRNVVSKAVQAPFHIVGAAISGKSITGAIDKNVTQVVGKGLLTSGALLPLTEIALNVVPGVGTAAAIGLHAAEAAAALAKLHAQKDATKAGSAQAIAIQNQINATQAQIDKLKASDPSYAAEFDNANKPAQYIPGVSNKLLAGGAVAGIIALIASR